MKASSLSFKNERAMLVVRRTEARYFTLQTPLRRPCFAIDGK
jgi:hypothetical protein